MSDLYVDPQSGNDSTGNGSSGSPWKSLQKAIDNASGGDTIHMANTAADVLSSSISWSSGWSGGTSADAPLIIRAWDNGGSLIINHPRGNIDCWELDGNDAVSTLFSTTSMPQHVILIRGKLHSTTGKLVDPVNYWVFLEDELYDNGSSAMVDYAYGTITIGCYLHTFASGFGMYGGVAIGNYLDSPSWYGIRLSGSGVAVGNILKSCTSTGIFVESDLATVINNTVLGTSGSIGGGLRVGSGAEYTIAHGNIFVDFSNASGCGIMSGAGGNFALIGHNHFHNNTTDKSGVVVKGLDLGGDVVADPGFVDAAGGDFRISTAGKAKGWPMGWPGSATLNFLDTGAAQRLEQSLIHLGMGGGMNG
jgi:hypothetical protein